MRSFTLSYHCQPESIHHITHVISFLRNPADNYIFRRFRGEISNAPKHFHQFRHDAWSIFRPTFLHILLGILFRSNKEETCLIPQFFHEVDATLYQGDYRSKERIAVCTKVYTVLFQYRLEKVPQAPRPISEEYIHG